MHRLPQKARQLTSNGRDDDFRGLAPLQGKKALIESLLRPLTDGYRPCRAGALPPLQRYADSGRTGVFPGCADECFARMHSAGLCDTAAQRRVAPDERWEGTNPREAIRAVGRLKRRTSPISQSSCIAVFRAIPRKPCTIGPPFWKRGCAAVFAICCSTSLSRACKKSICAIRRTCSSFSCSSGTPLSPSHELLRPRRAVGVYMPP